MDRPKPTHESRCQLILIGGVLRKSIENRARAIAAARSAEEIAPEDVEKATKKFLEESLSDLPHLIEEALENYLHQNRMAA